MLIDVAYRWMNGAGFLFRITAGVASMPEHVLVVDDDPSIRTMLTLVLQAEGYRVTTASNGAEALQEVDRDPPCAMLLDMQMPVLDGWGVARRLRDKGHWVPTIVMTAATRAAQWGAEVGADGYLPKPFDIDDLILAVHQVQESPACNGSLPR
jgi:DNA-binding response OmpR family regulator